MKDPLRTTFAIIWQEHFAAKNPSLDAAGCELYGKVFDAWEQAWRPDIYTFIKQWLKDNHYV